MICDACNATIPEGDDHPHQRRTLCEDCCMDAMSTVKACDPWAVYTAKNLEQSQGGKSNREPAPSIPSLPPVDGKKSSLFPCRFFQNPFGVLDYGYCGFVWKNGTLPFGT